MADDDEPSAEPLKQLNERLSYLELMVREQLARLYAIEQRLGLVYRPPFDPQQRLRPPEPQKPGVDRPVQPPAQIKPEASAPRPESKAPETPPTSKAPEPPGVREVPFSAGPSTSLPEGGSSRTSVPPGPRETAPPALPSAERGAAGPPTLSSGARETSSASVPPTRSPGYYSPRGANPPRPGAPPGASGLRFPADEPRRARTKPEPRKTLEFRIGGSLFTWIGAVGFCLAVGFLLKLGVDSGMLTEAVRVWMGAGAGIVFLAGGEWFRRKYPSYGYVLSGIGLVTLYGVVWAAFTRYHLIEQSPAFILMALITLTASLLAARYSAYSIAILALLGGFGTPIMLSTGQNNEVGLFSYVALLDAGVLVLAYSKRWHSLSYLAFLGTVLMFVGWYVKFYDPDALWMTFGFLSVFFVIFALLAVFYNVINRTRTGWLDLSLVFVNAIIYFGTSYTLLEDRYHPLLGAFAVFVSAFYLGLGYFTYWRDREDRLLVLTFLGLAFLFIVLAVPIQLDQHWVTMAWAAEAAIMTWIGLQVNDRTSRYAALVVFVIAISHWVLVDVNNFAYSSWEHFTPILNRRALSCAVLVAALSAAAFLFKRQGSEVEEQERSMFSVLYLLGANVLAVTLLSLDANDYFEQAKNLAREQIGPDPLASADEFARLNRSHQLTLTELWTAYGAITLIVGIVRRLKSLRVIGLILLSIATLKLLTVEFGYYAAGWQTTLFNPVFGAFGLLIAGLAVAAGFYARTEGINDEEQDLAVPVLIGAANLLAIIALSSEVIGHFERVKAGQPIDLASIENTKQLALTAVWVIYGAVALIVGIKRATPLRWGALALLAAATAKVLVVDLMYYDAPWHLTLANLTFGSFGLLVLGFVVTAQFCRRADAISEAERSALLSGLIGVAVVLVLVALSAEVLGHYDRIQAPILARQDTVGQWYSYENTKQMMLSWLWTIYATAALAVGVRRKIEALRWGGICLLGLATFKVLIIDARFYDAAGHSLVINQTFGAFAVLIVGMASTMLFYVRSQSIDQDERHAVIQGFTCAANLLAIIALSAEALGHFQKLINAPGVGPDELHDLGLAKQLSLSVIWTVYGGAMLGVGMLKRSLLLRVMALILLGLTIIKVSFVDLWFLAKLYRTISLIVLSLTLLAVSYLYQRYRQQVAD